MGRITRRVVEALVPDPARKVFAWDSELRGFGVVVSPGGVHSYVIQYRNTSGRERRMVIARYSRMSPDEARDKARKLLNEAADGKDPADKRAADRTALTVKDLCEEYLDRADKGLILKRNRQRKKASTVYSDRGRVSRHIVPLIGHRSVRDITTRDVRAFMNDVIAGKTAADVKTGSRGRAIVKGGRTAASRTVGLLGSIFVYAVSEGYRDDNPVHGVARPADRRRRVRLDPKEYREFGKALDASAVDVPWQAIVAARLIALTGCRKSEIQGLKWSEIDEVGRVFRLTNTKSGAEGEEVIRPIGTAAVEVLREARKRCKGEAKSDYVLPSVRGNGKPFGGLAKPWNRIMSRAGLDVTPHGLRHSFASVAESLGFTLPVIGALLGHAGSGVTAGYVHHADAALLAAADRVSRTIAIAMTGEAGQVVEMPRSAKA